MICIENEKYVMDESAIKFTKTFYSTIFAGHSVCESFERARSSVVLNLNKGQANMYQMLVQEHLPKLELNI